MKITIIIPVYNGENSIVETLQSCSKQTYKDITILVVNDGSTDRTKLLVEDYQKSDGRVLIINKPNGGLVSARYTGAEAASTEYICFIDADDLFEPNAIELLVNKLNEEKTDIIYSNFFVETEKKILFESNNDFYSGNDRLTVLENILKKRIAPTIWGKIIRKELFLMTKTPYDVTIGEDALFIVQLLSYETKISYIEESIYHYIQQESSMVNIKSTKKNNQRILFLDYMKDFIFCYYKDNASIMHALRTFIMSDIFEYLRDRGDFEKIKDLLLYAKGKDSIMSFRNNIKIQKLLMINLFFYTPTLGKLYCILYNIARSMYRGI